MAKEHRLESETKSRLSRARNSPRLSVFFDLFEAEEATELEARAKLLRGLERWLADRGRPPTEDARFLGVTHVRLSEIKRGRIGRFSVGLLFRLATRAGLHPQIVLGKEAYEPSTKRLGTLADFFADSPLRGSGLKAKRSRRKRRAGERHQLK